MIKTAIVEGAGFTGGELIRLLLNHPDVDLRCVTSRYHYGERIDEVHRGLYGETEMTFDAEVPLENLDMLFLCTESDESRAFIESHALPERLRVVDLSRAYRLPREDSEWVYGLPELNRRATCSARLIANPGNFATSILLGLLPLARNLMLADDIIVHSIIGSTGSAERSQSMTGFSWRNDNINIYKPFVHQHIPEVQCALKQLQQSFDSNIVFVPCHGNFTRGIFTTIIVPNRVALPELERIYEEYYDEDSFTHISHDPIDLKQVVNTNKCLIHLERNDDYLLVNTCIDNLLKGASGQAVHNMNLLFNLEETVGLQLKSTAI